MQYNIYSLGRYHFPFFIYFQIIYVYRNPKDAALSYFHHFRLWNNYSGTQDQFLEAYVQDKGTSSEIYFLLSFYKRPESRDIVK